MQIDRDILDRLYKLEASSAAKDGRIAALERHLEETDETVGTLMKIYNNYSRYGWFVMGFLFLGALLMMGFEKARDKLISLIIP